MGWMDAAKRAIETAVRIAEENKRADLLLALAELKVALAEAREEAADARARVRQLEESLRDRGELEYDNRAQVYRRKGDPERLPYCPVCYAEGTNIVMLVNEHGSHQCHKCKAYRYANKRLPPW